MDRAEVLRLMWRGFGSLEASLQAFPVPEKERPNVKKRLQWVLGYREKLKKQGGGKLPPLPPLPNVRSLRLKARGTRTAATHGEYYLNDAERAEFEATGILGPYNVMSRDEALKMRDYVKGLHETEFGGRTLLKRESIDALKKGNLWGIDQSGLYQALNYKPLWDLHASKQITQRMASLLGDDIICWRTQMFEKRPGAPGTFWHQTETFRETSKKAKLEPTRPDGSEMVQLTAWIALNDTTISNGAMRFVPGSFRDNRLEAFTFSVVENVVDYLARFEDEKELETVLSILQYSPVFEKSQAMFEMAMRCYDDLYAGCEVRDVEVKAGDYIIFTSLNVHASNPNTTQDHRATLVGRYTTNDVKVLNGWTTDTVSGAGDHQISLDRAGCFQVHGEDRYGWNKILPYPW